MAPLPVDLRNQLARTIQAARRDAESGAKKAIESLAVHLAKAHDSMDSDANARALRARLRAHGKQLGDVRHSVKDTQTTDHLKHEVAYEHWHRMLFARFLAENHLLIEPVSGQAVSLTDCEELAREQHVDSWTLAASFAQRMLPKIFRTDDPVLEVVLPPETRLALERHLESLPHIVFTADDSLGWTYQFWQAEKKEEVNRAGGKIGADELPAKTQLFTDHYMVLFLFHNTIGAWRAGRLLANRPDLARSARDENELRQAVRLSVHGGYEFTYLRFVRQRLEGDSVDAPSGAWTPVSGTFDGWPRCAADLRILDPCCGSGHFLIEGFELLVRLRMEEEGLAIDRAIACVIEDNLNGLEVDARCTQIAAFNLALAAWKLVGNPIELPQVSIGCSGTAVTSTREEWVDILPRNSDPQIRFFFGELHSLFAKAPTLGSLINPRLLAEGRLGSKGMEALLAALADAVCSDAPERHELGVAAQGLAKAAELLAREYALVITNVPYLGRGEQGEILRTHIGNHYSLGKADLATAFLMRCLEFCAPGGSIAIVTPHSLLFQTSYTNLRVKLLQTREWNCVVRLGEHAFESPAAAGAFAAMSVMSARNPSDDSMIAGIDVSATRDQTPIRAAEKAAMLRGEIPKPWRAVRQAAQLERPDAVITFDDAVRGAYLRDFAGCYQGLTTGDDGRWRRHFWEAVPTRSGMWRLLQGPSQGKGLFAGREDIVHSALVTTNEHGGALRGREAWGKTGVAIDRVGSLARSLYSGDLFHSVLPVVVPHLEEDLTAVAAFCLSEEFISQARALNPSLSIDNGYVNKLPFDMARWREVAKERYPSGLPEPESDDPTQWLFHGLPDHASAPLQVAVSRVLGFRWPPEFDESIRLSARARELVQRCNDLLPFAESSGIVCVPSVLGEKSGSDRVLAMLSACGMKADRDVDEWLRNEFFEEHCALFHHRPLIWHIWDGRSDGFHALVNYHRLAGPNGQGRRTLEALTYSYLGAWIEAQKADQRDRKAGADARLASAQDLQTQLQRILAGEPPCDIFVRWKPLHEQPIGWNPDLNDGVRINIRPFMSVTLRKGGRAGAGILRWKPATINWIKDRGTEPQEVRPLEDFPWFWHCPGEGSLEERTNFSGSRDYDGKRWNDLHYSNAAKQAARDAASTGRNQ